MFRKLLRLLGVRSPSETLLLLPPDGGPPVAVDIQESGRSIAEGLAAGIEQAARETGGMTWDERVRRLPENTDPETTAYAEAVARRSFPALYEDEEADVRD